MCSEGQHDISKIISRSIPIDLLFVLLTISAKTRRRDELPWFEIRSLAEVIKHMGVIHPDGLYGLGRQWLEVLAHHRYPFETSLVLIFGRTIYAETYRPHALLPTGK